MKKLRIVLLLMTLVTGKQFITAQINPIKQFSEDPAQFPQELQTMFGATSWDKREQKDFMEYFLLNWNSPRYTSNIKKATYTTCNMMVKKKVRILPEYKMYLTAVLNFVNSTLEESTFLEWQESIYKIVNGKNLKNYSDYLEMSESLFASNTFYLSAVIRYVSSNNQYSFEYDSVPKVVFPSMDLRIYNNQNDSGIVYNTKGVFYPLKGIFVGAGGKVTWMRAGLEESMVWAELRKYQIILKTSGYTADSVVFYNLNYFPKPVTGVLTEKVVSEKGNNISYPRFESYSKRMDIPNLAKDVDYSGGFSMRGERFLGSGSKEEDATLTFKKDQKPFLIVGAKNIGITAEKLTAESSRIAMYFGKDSITHPSVGLKYLIKERQLSLIRNTDGISKSPFLNSFHDVDMLFEELYWKTDDPKIDLRMLVGNSQEDAMFESANYFRTDRYDRIQGMDQMNPLIQIRDFVRKNGDALDFDGMSYSRYLKFALKDVIPSLIRLSTMGFITYDVEGDHVHVNQKLFDYIAARAAKIDYDVIQFPSVVRGASLEDRVKPNASINLLNFDMTVYGVKQIFMSDSQNVVIYPAEQKIILKKNRDFTFAGVVHAGRFDFFGKEFAFDYEKFMIDLKNVDSLRLMVKAHEADAYGEFPLVKVKTVIENINGSLEIDNPANKSGRKPFPAYPIFNSFKDSRAFYNKKFIQNGKYPKDNFYFHLEPFTIDSLDNFSNQGLAFQGKMITAGIFPTFKESLTLQPDYSLGFVTKAPADGYPVYDGRAVFKNTIKLSNQGLRGDGTLHYITSVSTSKDFIFYPDSTNAITQSFIIKEQSNPPPFPEVNSEGSTLHFEPLKDKMYVINAKDKKFKAYNGMSEFNGRLILTPQQLYGRGQVDFSTAKLESKWVKFKQKTFDADTANFSLLGLSASIQAFSTANVKAHIDFEKRIGEFKSNGKSSPVHFPVNQYICYMDKFKWYMDESIIELGSDQHAAVDTSSAKYDDLELDGPEFISIHPQQDSLRFHSPSAKFDLKNSIISAKNVKYINVADARIYPDKGDVTIEKAAVMRVFKNAKIVANAVTKYHNIYNGTINVNARRNYVGSGYYDYMDANKNRQTFYFSNISVDTTYQTYAETEIRDTSKFRLSPYYDFQGKVKLKASKQFLVFDGSARISHDCARIPRTWFKFESEINPLLIYIPVSTEAVDAAGKPIAASLMVTTDSTHFYTAFLSPKESPSDPYVLPASGFMFYDKDSREYRISNKEKIVERSLPGNYLSLNTSQCKVYGEGTVNLGGDLGQVKVASFGTAIHYLIPDSVNFDLIMSIDFFFDDNAIEKMSDQILEAGNLKATDFSRPVFEKGMREMVGKEQADKLISQLNLYGAYKKFPDEMKKTLFINDIKMQWNKNTRSYISSGKIGIGNINKTQVNKYVDGRIELVKKRGGDVLNIYLEVDGNTWYFFNYTRGTMLAVSSNEAFNTILKELKPEKREKAGDKEKKEANYYYNICPPSKKTNFLRKTSTEE